MARTCFPDVKKLIVGINGIVKNVSTFNNNFRKKMCVILAKLIHPLM